MPKARFRPTMGTGWFLAILVIAAITAWWQPDRAITAMVLGLCGAVVAVLNIKAAEERDFLISIAALAIVIMALLTLVPATAPFEPFLVNLLIAFGVAGFIVALSLIAKLGLD
jgi:peptidoglycan/LPS O-acetylase OafA/YrhL